MRKLLLTISVLAFISTVSFSQTIKVENTKLQTEELTSKDAKVQTQQDFLTQKKERFMTYSDSTFRTENKIPNSFPKYVNTGNIKEDTSLFDTSFKSWVKNNKEEYDKIKDALSI